MLAHRPKLQDVNFQKEKKMNYSARVKIRLTQEEKERLQAKAAAADMNLSQYMRAIVDRKKIVVAPELPQLVRQLIRIGTNTNQILLVNQVYGNASTETAGEIEKNLSAITDLTSQLVTEIKCRKDTTRYKL